MDAAGKRRRAGLVCARWGAAVRSAPAKVRHLRLRAHFDSSESAGRLLAFCDMRTMYLRNVPDEVVHRLEKLAAVDGMSVGAVAVRELAAASRRADNPELLGALPDLDIASVDIVEDLTAGRAAR